MGRRHAGGQWGSRAGGFPENIENPSKVQHADAPQWGAADSIESPVGGATAAPRFEPGNLWQALVAGISSRSWTGRVGKSRQPEERREQPQGGPRQALEEAKIGSNPLQDRPGRPPREAKTTSKSIKIPTCSQDGSRYALGAPKGRRIIDLKSFLALILEAKIEKNGVQIRCHF